jgi:NAD(P)-dependent dehydrogenase (short-subunit alcohol dehydrogenase family)
VLINIAGIQRTTPIETLTVADIRDLFEVNAIGTMIFCREALRHLPDNGGVIVNVASSSADHGNPYMSAYTASKGAVAALTRNVAAHCRAQGLFIRCNAVIPGGIKTPMTAALVSTLPHEVTDITLSPSASFCDPVDVAHAVTYLLGEESRFVNGSELRVDNALLSAIA